MRSLDDVIFVEFDRNPNFIYDNILPDVVYLRNQCNCSLSYVMLSDVFHT